VSGVELPLVAAIELGGTKIAVAVGRHPDALIAQTVIATTTPDETLGAVHDWLHRHGEGITAIGVAAFGPVALSRASPDWGSVTRTVKPHWSNTAIARPLADAFGVPVAFDTDVNGAAIGEHRWGALAGCRVGLYLTIGTGVGGGLIIDGRPLHGLSHPEMGHIRLKRGDDGFAGVCPFHGDCLEGLVSGPAILSRLGCNLSEATPDQRDAVFDDIGQGLSSFALAMSPERIVIGGGVAKAPAFHAHVEARLRHWLGGYVTLPAGYVTPPALGDRAGVAGAIALAHDLLSQPT